MRRDRSVGVRLGGLDWIVMVGMVGENFCNFFWAGVVGVTDNWTPLQPKRETGIPKGVHRLSKIRKMVKNLSNIQDRNVIKPTHQTDYQVVVGCGEGKFRFNTLLNSWMKSGDMTALELVILKRYKRMCVPLSIVTIPLKVSDHSLSSPYPSYDLGHLHLTPPLNVSIHSLNQ